MSMRESRSVWRAGFLRGQSIVELAMMTPLLLILLSGVFEFGFLFANYLAVADATRNSARFSSDSDYSSFDAKPACEGTDATKDFYRQTACLAIAELKNEQPTIALCLPGSDVDRHCPRAWDMLDDVIISVFAVTRERNPGDPYLISRFPYDPAHGDLDHFMTSTVELGWSYSVDLLPGDQDDLGLRTGMHSSNHTSASVMSELDPANVLNAGFVYVEINFHYYQILALPWFTQFISDPIPFRFHAVWPLSSVEPTSTPRP